MAGYSGTPLVQKLGIQPDARLHFAGIAGIDGLWIRGNQQLVSLADLERSSRRVDADNGESIASIRVEQLIDRIREGPPGASVEDVEIQETPFESLDRFEVRH